MQILITIALIVIGVLLFELLIFAHEFGHFITAKKSGVQVNEFALGMGPKIFSFKKGETTYSLRAFPIGGFCSMEGEDEESDNPRAFTNAKVWKRMIIIVAGAVMNIIMGFVLTFVNTISMPVFADPVIVDFTPVSYTATTGLQVGDEVLSVGGYSVLNYQDLMMGIQLLPCDEVKADTLEVYKENCESNAFLHISEMLKNKLVDEDTAINVLQNKILNEQMELLRAAQTKEEVDRIYRETIDLFYSSAKLQKPEDFKYPEYETPKERYHGEVVVERDGKKVTLDDVHFYTVKSGEKTTMALDFYLQRKEKNFGTVMQETATGTLSQAKIVWKSLELLVRGRYSISDMSGPVGMTKAVSDVAAVGLERSFGDAVLNIVFIMALITVNLGIFNMLPFPALDGGRFVFLLIEAIFRKPIPRKVEYIVNGVGLALLIGLIIFITTQDIQKLVTGTFPSVG